MNKKLCAASFLMACSILALNSQTCFAEEAAELSGTISIYASGTSAKGIQAAFEGYQVQHPDVELEISNFETVTDFETMMTTAFSSDTLPDMYIAQVGAVEQQYAIQGYLMNLSDTGVMDNLVNGDTSLITYEEGYFAFPMTTAISVTLCNKAELEKLGIELTTDNYPTNMDEFIDLLQQCRDAGVEYPFGVAGADSSSCTAWPFQYIYQVLYGDDPNFYANVLKGEKAWNGDEFRKMFTDYDRIREYVSPDSTAKSMDELYADFIVGDTLFFSQVATTIKSIQELDPETEIVLIPSSFTEKSENQTLISGFDEAFSITTSAKDPELCVDFLKYITSPEGSTLFDNATGYIPTVKGCESEVDNAYEIVLDIMQNDKLPNSPILSRQWIAGFKELLKAGCQNWLAGEEVDSVVNTIEEDHKRLMEADSDWVQNFLDSYKWK